MQFKQDSETWVRRNKSEDIQRFYCKACGRWFVINLGFKGMRATPQTITSAMQLYFTGESFRNVQKFLRLQGVNVSHQAVYNWVKKYVSLMEAYLDQIKPEVSDTWRADELYVKIKGNMKYLFALMDDEIRFWIAQEVADSKRNYDARPLFQKGKEAVESKPKTLITDWLRTYHEAYLKEFWTRSKETRTEHISHVRLSGDMNNIVIERLHGTRRDREKVVRELKDEGKPLLSGQEIFYNFVIGHQALNGLTPAQASNIGYELGQNKWLGLLKKAVQSRGSLIR